MHRRHVIWAGALALAGLAGCETTGSVDRAVRPETLRQSGLVLFSVTHTLEKDSLVRRGGNVTFYVELRDLDSPRNLPSAFSTNLATLEPVVHSSFEGWWGRVFVRELPVGRYALVGWSVLQNHVYSVREFRPKVAPPALTFEVTPGTVQYLGNVHGQLLWGRNPFGIDILAGAVPEVRNEADRDLAVILKDYPQLQGKVVVQPLATGVWQAP